VHPPAPVPPPDPAASPRVVVVIPSRWASSRLPGKPLADIAGRTMVERVYRRAAAARGVAGVLVATDDERIAAAVRAFGGQVALTRADHASGTDRIAEVAQGLACDLIVNVQGDEPALAPQAIEAAVAPLAADAAIPMGTLGAPIDAPVDLPNPNTVKVLVDQQGFALYFSRAAVPFRREGGEAYASVLRHVGLYVYRREFLLTLASLPRTPLERQESLEQLRALEHGHRIRVVETVHTSVSVDTPEDLERVRRLAADGLLA
jgi:3-deoxy-manno-octulosonate cytidylyltransferase (CMP-KDO synthetase)